MFFVGFIANTIVVKHFVSLVGSDSISQTYVERDGAAAAAPSRLPILFDTYMERDGTAPVLPLYI